MAIHRILSGKNEIEFGTGDNLLEPVAKRPKIACNNPMDALADPIGSPSLEILAEKASSITVILPDATRAWQRVNLMAEAVRDVIGKPAVDWIIAGGQHRFPTDEELVLLLGNARREGDRVHFHDPELAADTGRVTSGGNRVTMHGVALDADLVVMVGGIAYHELAGFSGGRKTLIPGISGRSSIVANHSMCLEGERVSPLIGCGRLEGNPVHEDMMEYARLALLGKKAFLLNVIPDERGIPWRYVAGDPFTAWRKGVEIASDLQTLYVDGKADWVVVSSGGYPYDIDLYQATKSVTAVMDGLKPGGTIVMVAGLEDGLGPGSYGEALEMSMADPSAVLAGLKKGFTIPAFCAFKLVQDLSEHPALLVTPVKDVPFPGIVCETMEEAIGSIPKKVFSGGRGIVLPAGNCVSLKGK